MEFGIKDVMKFDIKDVKSWATRNEVELGKIGFFADSIEQLYKKECVISKLSLITKIDAFSFGDENNNSYAFFLPLDAVKEDKPEKILTITRKEFRNRMLLGLPVTYREKKLPQCATTTLISRIDFDSNDDPRFCYINNRDFKDWFDNYEIMNADGEWQPFGVEVKENED